MDTPKREGMRRAWHATRCSSPRIKYRAEIAALLHHIREARDRLPLGELVDTLFWSFAEAEQERGASIEMQSEPELLDA